MKVQYPGVREAIESDLDAAEVMYAMFSAMMLKGLDAKGLVDELRARMREELDYRLEARNITEFEERFRGHPWVRIPKLVPEFSTEHLLTTEWIDGMSFDEFRKNESDATKQRAGESIWRFAQNAIFRHGIFNGDPAPRQLQVPPRRQRHVPRLRPREALDPRRVGQPRVRRMDAIIVDRDPELLVTRDGGVGFLRPGHGLDPGLVYDYVSRARTRRTSPTNSRSPASSMRDTIGAIIDVKGPHGPVIEQLNMPPSFVILDRVVWGVSAILGKLEVTAPWRAMLLEYTGDGPPATDLGAAEAAWFATRPVA